MKDHPPDTKADAALEPPSARTSAPAPRVSSETGELRAGAGIRPLYDRVLAQRVDEQNRTSGGLFIPDNAKEKPLEAVVIAVGSGKLLANGTIQPIAVKAGDKILIAKYSGSDVKTVGKDRIIVREDDILGILEEDRR